MKGTFYYLYILHCENDAYYTGYTTDIKRRYQEHVVGTNKCKFTRSFKPLRIAQCWKMQGSKALAMQIEKFIKTLSKKEKEILIHAPQKLVELLKKYNKLPLETHGFLLEYASDNTSLLEPGE